MICTQKSLEDFEALTESECVYKAMKLAGQYDEKKSTEGE